MFLGSTTGITTTTIWTTIITPMTTTSTTTIFMGCDSIEINLVLDPKCTWEWSWTLVLAQLVYNAFIFLNIHYNMTIKQSTHGNGNVTKKAIVLKDKPFLNLEYSALLQIQKDFSGEMVAFTWIVSYCYDFGSPSWSPDSVDTNYKGGWVGVTKRSRWGGGNQQLNWTELKGLPDSQHLCLSVKQSGFSSCSLVWVNEILALLSLN